MSRRPRFTEEELRDAVRGALCYSDVLRGLGLRAAGGNPRTTQKYIALWGIPVDHFVERPPYEQLLREIAETSWSAVGRSYGVSDNTVRKWVRWYEAERAAA